MALRLVDIGRAFSYNASEDARVNNREEDRRDQDHADKYEQERNEGKTIIIMRHGTHQPSNIMKSTSLRINGPPIPPAISGMLLRNVC